MIANPPGRLTEDGHIRCSGGKGISGATENPPGRLTEDGHIRRYGSGSYFTRVSCEGSHDI